MPSFLTVKEAARRTGKSPSSIRRIMYGIRSDDNHPDRSLIHPDPRTATELHIKGENFPWKISEELLARIAPQDRAGEKGSAASTSQSADAPLIAMLQRELEIKNQQIETQAKLMAQQMQLIDGLGERIREGNVLIGTLHQRLALTDGSTRSAVVDVPTAAVPTGESHAKKQKSAPKAAKQKRSLFSRLFKK